MRMYAMAGALGLILIPSFLKPQDASVLRTETVLVTANVTVESAQNAQQKKSLRESNRSDEVPIAVSSKKPDYPESALKDKAEGLVEAKLYVDKQGTVTKVEIAQSSGRQDLDDAAVEAAKQYKFTPARLNGAPVNSWASVPFQFQIESTPSTTKGSARAAALPPVVIGRDDRGGEEIVAKPQKIKSTAGPSFSKIVRPKYPEAAKMRHATDDVAVAVTIDEKGDVIAVSSQSQASDELTESALAAAAKCTFVPARRNGQAVESTALIHYLFGRDKPKSYEEKVVKDHSPVLSNRDSLKTASDTLFQSAERRLTRGDINAAEEAYQSLIKLNDFRGYVGLGKVNLIRENWGRARHQFDKAIELNPTNIETRYYAAISYRESGRWRSAGQEQDISIEHAYEQSMQHFQWILLRDSSYQDVLYQYSLLMKDQERYPDAMEVLCAQLRLKPGLPIAWSGMVRLVRAAVHAGRAAEIRARAQSMDESVVIYVHAEELRIQGLLAEAEDLFSRILRAQSKMPPQCALMSLVRIYAKKEQFQSLEQTYWKGVEEIKDEAGAALILDDVKYILSPQENVAFVNLSSTAKRDQFFPSVWNRRNPTLASPSNPRLQEHYQRLLYAEEHYYLDRERFSFFYSAGRPGLDFDFKDIGRVYIRQGPPDQVLNRGGGSESWLYESTGDDDQMIFQFSSSTAFASPAPMVSATQGGRHIWSSRVPEPRVPDVAPGIQPLQKVSFAPDLAFWDPDYFYLSKARTELEAQMASNRLEEKARRSYVQGMTTERFVGEKTVSLVSLPSAISTFRAGTGKSVIEVAYAIPAASLVRESGDTLHPMEVESGFAIYDRHWRKIVSVAETLQVSLSTPTSSSYYRLHQTQVKPDSYYVAVYAHPIKGNVLAKSEAKVMARDYWNAGFTMSDPQLAFEVRKADEFSMFDKEGLRVVVNPLNRQAVNRPMYVYFELYNTTEISKEQSDLHLELVIRPVQAGGGVVSKVLGLFSGEKKGYFVTSEVDHWKTKKALAKYLVVDVTRMEPGRYALDISVEDKPTKKSVSRSVEFELVSK